MKANRKYIIRLLGIILSCLIIVVFTACTSNSSNSSKSTDDIISDSTSNQPQDTTDSNNSATEPPEDSTTDSTTEPSKSGTTKSPGLEWGFIPKLSGCRELPHDSMAYRIDKTDFDIDDVKVTIYFGGYFSDSIELERECGRNIPEFEIYFSDSFENCILPIRQIEENYVSEKYRMSFIYDDSHHATEMIFNHSEEITIPKELFSEEKGLIRIIVGGVNVRISKYQILNRGIIRYEMIGTTKVRLSPVN